MIKCEKEKWGVDFYSNPTCNLYSIKVIVSFNISANFKPDKFSLW